MVENLPAKTGCARVTVSVPGLGEIPWKKEMAAHSTILGWKIPWIEDWKQIEGYSP